MPTTLQHKPHVAIIMDGNGRWAEPRGVPRPAGHPAGAATARPIDRAANEEGIGAPTHDAFST
jgi:undecaprenyl diphosphate synthase